MWMWVNLFLYVSPCLFIEWIAPCNAIFRHVNHYTGVNMVNECSNFKKWFLRETIFHKKINPLRFQFIKAIIRMCGRTLPLNELVHLRMESPELEKIVVLPSWSALRKKGWSTIEDKWKCNLILLAEKESEIETEVISFSMSTHNFFPVLF